MLSGTNLEYTRSYNQRVVLEAIRLHEPVSRAEIARHTGLSNQTVSNIVGELLARGVIKVGDKRLGRRGQPALEIRLNPEGAFSIGLHLDRDHLSGVLMDLGGTVHQQVHYDLQMPSPREALRYMEKAVLELRHRHPRAVELWGVGVALPGPMEMASGRVVAVPNFPGWGDVAVRDGLEERLGVLVYLENDATAAATGERWHGVGRAFSDFFYVYLGFALGGGVVIGGHPHRGFSGNAGEFGHTFVAVGKGAQLLGNYVSPEELYRIVGVPRPTALEPLFRRRDPRVMEWLTRAADFMAPALVTVESLLDPQALIFGGRIPRPLIRHLVEGLEARLGLYRLPGKPFYPRLLLGQAQQDSACLGAATLPFYEEIAPSHHLLLKKVGGGVS